MAVLQTLTNSGTGVTTAVYRSLIIFTKASTHTAQTLVPMGTVRGGGTVKAIHASWLEVSAANTTLATIQVLKRSNGGAAAGTALLSTAGTLTNNATAQNTSSISTAFTPTLNTGSANVNPVLSTTAATVALADGDQLVLTTTASSTQGTDLSVTVEVEYNLADDKVKTGLN